MHLEFFFSSLAEAVLVFDRLPRWISIILVNMGRDQDLLDAARNGNVVLVEKLLSSKTKRGGPLARFVIGLVWFFFVSF